MEDGNEKNILVLWESFYFILATTILQEKVGI